MAAVDVQAGFPRWVPEGLTDSEAREYAELRDLEESLVRRINAASDRLRRARSAGPPSRGVVRELERAVDAGYERLRHVRARVRALEAVAVRRRRRGRARGERQVRVLWEEV